MDEQTLRAYLDRLAHVRSRFEVHQQDIREMLISLDVLFEALCRELAAVRAPFPDPPVSQVPDPQLDPDGYCNHLYQQAAEAVQAFTAQWPVQPEKPTFVVPEGYRLVKVDGRH